MNFNQLKYIIAVDHQRNFSRAAEECGIAQSTLSKEIQRLEKEFGIMIFDRSRQPVTPTMKGVDLIQQAKIILNAKNRFIDIAIQKQNQPIGNFRLGILPTLAPYLLPLFIRPLGQKYPELHVEILELTSHEMIIRFEENELDGAIAISPFIKEGFYESYLFEEDFILYISPEHPLSQQKEVSWADIPLHELLLHEAFQGYILSSEEIKNNTGLTSSNLHNINYQSGSLETIRKIIDRSGGLTLLPQLAATYMGERRLKMVRPIVNPTLKRNVSFITPRGFEKTRITKVLKREILAGLPED
ncbi:MAG TPA: LysR substrate-binding domain-containing protein [Flavobacteriaceae bacterium]|nr:LysR substrate-binding domain-containing protein [Flavobacteriaceae bacterium]